MPLGGLLSAIIGVAGPAILGGIAGATNPRPPSLDPTQKGALDALIPSLMPTATGQPKIDPIQQSLLYGQNAQALTGANNAITHALVSRGLGRSGLLGAGLIQNQNQSQANQNQINLGLQNQAIQQKQLSIQDILGLLGVGNTPGQSGPGAFFSGLAPVAAYSIQSQLNRNSFGGTYGGYTPGQLGAPGSGPVDPTTGLPVVIPG